MKTLLKITVFSLAAMLLASTIPSTAGATGYGLGFTYHDSRIEIDEEDGDSVDWPVVDSSSTGISFVIDTAVAKRRIFNYRLSLGYEQQRFDGSSEKVNRVTWGNTFGFGIVQTTPVRVWMGPRLAFGLGFDNTFDDDYLNYNIGLAPVLGVNFNLGPVVSLGLEVGYDFSLYFKSYPDQDDDTIFSSGSRIGPFLNVVMLFRTPEDRFHVGDSAVALRD